MMRDYVELTYRDHPHTHYPMHLAEYLCNRFHVIPGSKVLDYGCGRGDFVDGFMRAGMHAYGYEPNSDYCRKIWPSIENRFSIMLEDRDYHMIFSKSVFEHLREPITVAYDMFFRLNSNCPCIAMVPDYRECGDSFWDDVTHVHPFTEKSLKQLLEWAGFDSVGCETFDIPWTEPEYSMLLAWGYKP